MPSPVTNHNLPSADFATRGPYSLAAEDRSLTPSAASQTVVSTLCFGSAIQAFSSVRAMRTKPQLVYNQRDRSSSAIVALIVLHGKPFAIVSVVTRPFFILLRPPYSVATHNAS